MSETVILGAGLTGLSSAYFLEQKQQEFVVFEKEKEAGGLCRTKKIKDYLFDYTGHLLHLKNKRTKKLLSNIMSNQLELIHRKASVFSFNRYTDYPFQANLKGLPEEVIKDCILGLFRSLENTDKTPGNLEEWFISVFGKEMANYFMIPYNRKLWCRNLKEMSYDWVSWSVPRPNIEEVINGALGIKNPQFGYNPSFYYPIKGGIASLVKAFSSDLESRVFTGKKAVQVDLDKKVVTFADNSSAEFKYLVSTIPLTELVGTIKSIPEKIAKLASDLKWINVLDINLGISRENINPAQWVYFPEEKYPFYRIGFPANFSSSVAPERHSTMYIEIAYCSSQSIDNEKTYSDCIDKLIKLGILQNHQEIVVSDIINIEPAYVIFDEHRKRALPEIMKYLHSKGVYSIGRYGSWDYMSMEDSIIQAQNTMDKIDL